MPTGPVREIPQGDVTSGEPAFDGPLRQRSGLVGVSGDDLAEVLEQAWGKAAPATWNRNRAAPIGEELHRQRGSR